MSDIIIHNNPFYRNEAVMYGQDTKYFNISKAEIRHENSTLCKLSELHTAHMLFNGNE